METGQEIPLDLQLLLNDYDEAVDRYEELLGSYIDLSENFIKYVRRQETHEHTNEETDECQCETDCLKSTTEKITWLYDFMRHSSERIFKLDKPQETVQSESQLDEKTTECEHLQATIARLNSDLMGKTAECEQLKISVESLNSELQTKQFQLDSLNIFSEKLCNILYKNIATTGLAKGSSEYVTQSDGNVLAKKSNSEGQQTSSALIQHESSHTSNKSKPRKEKFSVRNSTISKKHLLQPGNKHEKNANRKKDDTSSDNTDNNHKMENPCETDGDATDKLDIELESNLDESTQNQNESPGKMNENEDVQVVILRAVSVVYRAKVVVSKIKNIECNHTDIVNLMRNVYLAIVGKMTEKETSKPVTLPIYFSDYVEVFLPKTLTKILSACNWPDEGTKYEDAYGFCQAAVVQVYMAKQKFCSVNNLNFDLDETIKFTRNLFATLSNELDNTQPAESEIIPEPTANSSNAESLVSTVALLEKNVESATQKSLKKRNSKKSSTQSLKKRKLL